MDYVERNTGIRLRVGVAICENDRLGACVKSCSWVHA